MYYRNIVRPVLRYLVKHPNKYVSAAATAGSLGAAAYERYYTPSNGGKQNSIEPPRGRSGTRAMSLSSDRGRKRSQSNPFNGNATKMKRMIGSRVAHSGILRGKVRKPRRSVRRTTAYKMRKGVAFTYELGKVVSTGECQYIGHITHPQKLFLKNMWCSLLKALFIKAGVVFRTLEDVLPTLSSDSVVVKYQKNVLGTVSTFTHTPGAGANLINMSDFFIASGPWYGATNTSEWQDSAFVSIELKCTAFNPDVNSAFLDMSNMRVKYDVKSALKFQNRTLSDSAGIEADDVDNVPLYGKVYEGTGTGARVSTASNASFFYGDTSSGLITNTGATQNDIAEPPPPHMFPEVKKWSKISLSPGEIKTSVLSTRSSSKWNDIHNRIMMFSNSVSAVKRHIGKFRFFALEKIISSSVLGTDIQIAFEHQITFNTEVSTWVSQNTAVFFDKTYL